MMTEKMKIQCLIEIKTKCDRPKMDLVVKQNGRLKHMKEKEVFNLMMMNQVMMKD